MTTTQKIETLLAMAIFYGAHWFLKVLFFMVTAISVHFFIKWCGLSLPPYF
jgi:hypothetical protein